MERFYTHCGFTLGASNPKKKTTVQTEVQKSPLKAWINKADSLSEKSDQKE